MTRILEMLLLSGPLQTVVFPEPETQQSIDEAPGSDTDAHAHTDCSHWPDRIDPDESRGVAGVVVALHIHAVERQQSSNNSASHIDTTH